jgi:hypothetical protein
MFICIADNNNLFMIYNTYKIYKKRKKYNENNQITCNVEKKKKV